MLFIVHISSSFEIQSKATKNPYVRTVGNVLMMISPGQPMEEEQMLPSITELKRLFVRKRSFCYFHVNVLVLK